MNFLLASTALPKQEDFSNQLQIWGLDLWHWIFNSAISPMTHGASMVVGGIIGSGAFLGIATLYNLLNEEL